MKEEIPKGPEIEKHEQFHDIAVVLATPVLTAEQFEAMTDVKDAIILIGFATGTSPERLAEAIKKRVDSGVPVFLVSSNIGDPAGILEPRKYGATIPTLDAGAIPIERYNAKDLKSILDCVNKHLDEGVRGQDLAMAVQDDLSFHEGEEKPKTEWDLEESEAHE